jgi:hypothetical protein
MPVLDTTQIAAMANPFIVPDLRQQWKAFDPLLTYLIDKQEKIKKVVGGSADFKIPMVMSKAIATGQYTGYDGLNIDPNIQIRKGDLGWKFYYANMVVSDQELMETENSEAARSLFDALLENAKMSLRDDVGTDLYGTGTDSLKITGLRAVCDNTNSYAGLSPVTYPNWAPITDTTTNEVTLFNLLDLYAQTFSGGEAPDISVTTPRVWIKIVSLLLSQKRYGTGEILEYGPSAATSSGSATGPGDNDAIHKYVVFMGTKLFPDEYCPGSGPGSSNNHLFFLWSPALRFLIHKNANFTVQEKKIRPINQDLSIVPIRFAGQLICTKRRRQCMATALDPAA